MNKSINNQKKFINGALILALAGFLVKLLGFAFRIPLGRMIGAGGMGDYAPAYDVYAFILVIATAGIPVAISRLVSERCAVMRFKDAHRVFDISRLLMLSLGVLGFLLLFLGSELIAQKIGIESSEMAIKAISPTLLFAPIMSSYRGYFQGIQEMIPTATSQIVEQFFRVVVGLLAAYLLYNGVTCNHCDNSTFLLAQQRGAAGACLGALAGAVFGFVTISLIYVFTKKRRAHYQEEPFFDEVESRRIIFKQIVKIATPITIAACVMPLVNLADVAIVMRRLTSSGIDYETAKMMFGELTSFAAPIIGLPIMLIQAITIGIVPLVASAYKREEFKELRTDMQLGYKSSFVIALPCSVGMFALAEPIMLAFYGNQVDNAIPCLQIYAVAFIFLSVASISTAMLQGIGKQNIPVINLLLGLIVKIVITWYMSGIDVINVKGAALGTVAAYFIASILDVWVLNKYTEIKPNIKEMIIKPTISSLIMGGFAYYTYKGIFFITNELILSLFVAVFVGIALYAVLLLKGRTLSEEELILMPFGELAVKWFRKNRK